MGYTQTVHIGPWFECKVGEVETSSARRTCSNKRCERHGLRCFHPEVTFCFACGVKITDIDFMGNADAVDQNAVVQELKEVFTGPLGDDLYQWQTENDAHLYIQNRASEDHISFDPNEGMKVELITPESISLSLEAFNRLYSEQKKVFQSYYGRGNVTVRWGVLSYTW